MYFKVDFDIDELSDSDVREISLIQKKPKTSIQEIFVSPRSRNWIYLLQS